MRRVLVAFLLATALLGGASAAPVRGPSPALVSVAQAGNPYTVVWVDTPYGIYHCPGSKYYGDRRYGRLYLYQYQALQKGFRPAYGWVCR